MKLFHRIIGDPHRSPQEDPLMFEMQQIGRRIAASRKELDMTQQELADQLGVTYQAVSNWERGLSIPDVLRLKDLARLFSMSLDELMGNTEDVRILEVASGDRKPDSLSELAASAPYMKPSALEKELLDALPGSDPSPSAVRTPEPGITPIASKPSQEPPTAEPANSKTTVGSESWSLSDILAMAPFISPETLTKVIGHLIKTSATVPVQEITGLAPFLESELLRDLILQAISSHQSVSDEIISSLSPFLDPEDLEVMIQTGMSDGQISPDILCRVAPFMDPEGLDRILSAAAGKSVPGEVILALAPFLDSSTIGNLIRGKTLSKDVIQGLLPFADDEDLDAMILAQFNDPDRR